MTDAAIYVRKKGKRFSVAVEPAGDGDRVELFDSKKMAWGWACGQRMLRRLPIRDETEASR